MNDEELRSAFLPSIRDVTADCLVAAQRATIAAERAADNARAVRNEWIRDLRDRGMSCAHIASLLSMTRQAVHAICAAPTNAD